MRRGSLRAFWLIFLSGLVLMGLLTSCARSPYSLDQGRAVEKAISAKKGGEIGLKTAKGEKVSLTFPQQALKKDTSIVASPLTEAPLSDQKDILVKGVLLEEKGKEGKSLNFEYPVLLSFTVKGSLPEEATIVKYLPQKKSYEVVPTEITTKGKESILTAELVSLSAYGGKKGSKKEIKKAAEKTKKEQGAFWHIMVNDTVEKQIEFVTASYTLSLNTTNLSGKITGHYFGLASLTVKNRLTQPIPGVEKLGGKADLEGDVGFKIINPTEREGAVSFLGEGTLNLAVEEQVEEKTIVGGGQFFEAGSIAPAVDVNISGSQVKITVVRGPSVLNGLVFKGTLVRGKKR